jgi:hypothetical protein
MGCSANDTKTKTMVRAVTPREPIEPGHLQLQHAWDEQYKLFCVCNHGRKHDKWSSELPNDIHASAGA